MNLFSLSRAVGCFHRAVGWFHRAVGWFHRAVGWFHRAVDFLWGVAAGCCDSKEGRRLAEFYA